MPHPSRPSPRDQRREPFGSGSPPEFTSRTVSVTRVSRMVAGGRRFRFRVLVAVGNGKGAVGIGLGKGQNVAQAVEKATRRANASRVIVPRRKGTIPREILIKKGTARIIMRPARPGHGIVAGGVIRTLCELSGITDISAKILSRSTNQIVNARATIAGFQKLSERVAVAEKRRVKPITNNP